MERLTDEQLQGYLNGAWMGDIESMAREIIEWRNMPTEKLRAELAMRFVAEGKEEQ